MNLVTGFFSLTTGFCLSCLLFCIGEAKPIVSVSSEIGQSHAIVISQKEQQSILKSITRPMVKGTAIQSQGRVSRSSQRFLHELPLPSLKVTENSSADPFAAILAYGWQEYRLENYVQAKALFLQAAASDNAENRHNAEYGFMYSSLKLGDTRAALPLLQQFVDRGEHLDLTAPPLAAILFEQGDFKALQALLPKLSIEQQKEWQGRIVLARFQNDILTLGADSKHDEIRGFLQQYRSILNECRQQEEFFRLAALVAAHNPDLAKEIFADLSRCLPEDHHWQERVLREQLHLISNKDLLAAVSAPFDEKISESSWQRLLQESLWQRLAQLENKDSEYDSFVQALYEVDPNNQEAASMAAWSCYRRGKYDCARDIFSTLVQNNPTDDALLGLVYALQKKAAFVEALKLLEHHSDKQSSFFNTLRHDLHATLGGKFYQSRNYEEASAHLKQALTYQPEDEELTKMLLWSRYHLGEIKPLVDFLWQQYQKNGSVDTAESLFNILGTLNDPVFTGEVMALFAESGSVEVRKIAGDYAFQQKHLVLADQIYSGVNPYAGSAAPAFDSMFYFRSKGGDDGTSRLDTRALIMRQRISSQYGKTWSVVISPLFISSGNLPEGTSVGSAFRSSGQSQVQPELWQKDAFALDWRGTLQIEGDLDWDIEIGTTPVNGVIDPTLVGKIRSSGSDWQLAVERASVKDSMLSWLGQTDPYSGHEWGRVVQTSLDGNKTISYSDWWLAFAGKYGWYEGESVEHNTSLTASISGGYTTDWQGFERSTGLFVFARAFRRNSNFYTFGHGGYYSPAQQIIVGPFVHLVSSETTNYWLDFSCSAGLNYRKTDDAPHYTELGTIDIEPEDSGWQDLFGEYSGESETGLGLDAQIRGLLPLANGWFIGGEVSMNNVADFTQWQVAVALRYRFGKGMGLGLPERDFSMLTRLVQ